MKDKKKFKDTAVGKFLTEKVPGVLPALVDVADDFFPPAKLITAALAGQKLSHEDQLKLDSLLLEYEQNERRDYLADVANARSMQVAALQQEDKFSKRFVYYLASFIVLVASAFGVMLFFIDVPKENQRLVDMFCDVYLFAGALMVLNFFFGSSVRSLSNKVNKSPLK